LTRTALVLQTSAAAATATALTFQELVAAIAAAAIDAISRL